MNTKEFLNKEGIEQVNVAPPKNAPFLESGASSRRNCLHRIHLYQ